MSVKQVLDNFGKRIVQQSKSNLTREGKKDRGELYNSIDYELSVHKNSFHFSLKMADYGVYVDEGVKGLKQNTTAPKSPFRFGSGTGRKGGLTDAIDGWVRRNRIQFKNRRTGRFYTYKQTAFVITRSIFSKGLEATNFITKPFENEFKKLPDAIVKKYGLQVNAMLNQAMKK